MMRPPFARSKPRSPAWATKDQRVKVIYKGSNIHGAIGVITRVGFIHPDRVEVKILNDKHGRPIVGVFDRQPIWLSVAWLTPIGE